MVLESPGLDINHLPAAAGQPQARALLLMMAAKHRPTYVHMCQAATYTELLAKELLMDQEQTQLAVQAALLHDIGKVAIADEVLTKSGRLTDAEMSIVVQHAQWGADILAGTGGMEQIVPSVRTHHEWFNGRGYPLGIAGSEIPLYARMIGIADAFDTMVTPRPYRTSLSVDTAVEELERYSGSQFDPELVRAFRSAIRTIVRPCVTQAQRSVSDAGQSSNPVIPLAIRMAFLKLG